MSQSPPLSPSLPRRNRLLPLSTFQPPSRFQDQHSQSRPPGFIDLTSDGLDPTPVPIDDSPSLEQSTSRTGERAPKRRRFGDNENTESQPRAPRAYTRRVVRITPDEVDLTVMESAYERQMRPQGDALQILTGQQPDALFHAFQRRTKEKEDEKLLAQQRSQHQTLQKQQDQQSSSYSPKAPQDNDKPIKIPSIQCVVCMESMTDLTSTWCGHLFCHTCLMEALIAGENQDSANGKGPSRCPICRKKVVRAKIGGKDPGHVIPLELKLKPRSAVSKGKERASACN